MRDNRDKLREELVRAEEDEELLSQQLSERRRKVLRLRKQLRQAERRTEKAMDKELEDIEAEEVFENPVEEEGVEAALRPEFVDILEMDPNDWAVIDGVAPFWEVPNPQPEAAL